MLYAIIDIDFCNIWLISLEILSTISAHNKATMNWSTHIHTHRRRRVHFILKQFLYIKFELLVCVGIAEATNGMHKCCTFNASMFFFGGNFREFQLNCTRGKKHFYAFNWISRIHLKPFPLPLSAYLSLVLLASSTRRGALLHLCAIVVFVVSSSKRAHEQANAIFSSSN